MWKWRVCTLALAVATICPTALTALSSSPQQGRPEAVRIINGPSVEGTGRDWAVIAWSTNTGGSSVIRYGTDPNNLTQTAQSPYADNESTSYQTHRVRLTRLQPNTTYYYIVDSGQGEGTGTEAKSQVRRFMTRGDGAQYGTRNSGDATGYSPRDSEDRDYDRDRRTPYDENRQLPNQNGYGQGYSNAAQQVGYQDGLNDGRADRQTGHSSRARQQQAYQHADHNYSPAYGGRQQYKNAYRQAYLQGYERGYNGQQ